MNIHRILITAFASAALLQISAPAEASEVVKLARLVLTGKRTVPETPREPAASSSSGSGEKTSQAPTTGGGETGGNSTPELGSSSSSSGSLTGGHGSHIFLRAF